MKFLCGLLLLAVAVVSVPFKQNIPCNVAKREQPVPDHPKIPKVETKGLELVQGVNVRSGGLFKRCLAARKLGKTYEEINPRDVGFVQRSEIEEKHETHKKREIEEKHENTKREDERDVTAVKRCQAPRKCELTTELN
ncbi:unnamed protein product [Allacma fusca]|uniref:Uncharacterized protein n=1 Tax=Allacma fusca TaxID=39272 RepID=A0A8J2L4I8_9HEXA|nr:unnamed protein product [Allacma fusca]